MAEYPGRIFFKGVVCHWLSACDASPFHPETMETSTTPGSLYQYEQSPSSNRPMGHAGFEQEKLVLNHVWGHERFIADEKNVTVVMRLCSSHTRPTIMPEVEGRSACRDRLQALHEQLCFTRMDISAGFQHNNMESSATTVRLSCPCLPASKLVHGFCLWLSPQQLHQVTKQITMKDGHPSRRLLVFGFSFRDPRKITSFSRNGWSFKFL